MAKKILSFEEYSKKVDAPDVSEETKDEEIVTTEVEDEEIEDEEDESDDEDDEDEEDESDDEDEEDEEDESEDEDDEDDEDDDETPRSVAEMLKEVYEAAHNEAKSYEGDDYQEHTVESYMKEMAALNAGMMAEMYEASCNEVKEEEMTVEMYEATCNSMKEAYAKKMDEMMEAYSSDSNLDSEKDI